MTVFRQALSIPTSGQGMHEVTRLVAAAVGRSNVREGMMTVFCQHTSCSLVIMEDADPAARSDLEGWLNRLVPEHDPDFVHTAEGRPTIVGASCWRGSTTSRKVGGAAPWPSSRPKAGGGACAQRPASPLVFRPRRPSPINAGST